MVADLVSGSTAWLVEFVYASPFGLLTLFLFTIFANASLFFPILVEPIVFLVAALAPNMGVAVFIGLITGLAAAIGEMSGYIFGMLGVKTLQKFSKKKVEKIFEVGERLADKGVPIIFVAAFTPLPFDVIGIAAGMIRYDPKRFFLAALIGKLLRYTLVAIAGFLGASWLKSLLLL